MAETDGGREGRARGSGSPTAPGTRLPAPRARLAGELAAILETVGLSLKELERATHVSDSSLSRYLAGRSVPPWSVVAALCGLAGRDPEQLRPVWAAARGTRANTPGSEQAAPRDDLPRGPLAFIGRRAEAGALRTDPGVWVIDGMAGVGKSALAVHSARRIAEDRSAEMLYLHLHGHTSGRTPLAPAAALAALLHAVGVADSRIPQDLDQRAAFWRSEAARREPVVVLDDAFDADQVRPLLPGHPGAAVLVTSRRRLMALDGTRTLSLAVPSAAECRELVDAIAGGGRRRTEPEAVDDVVDLCGRLPLAVQLAASRLLHRPAWSVAFLAKRLREEGRRLRELTADGTGVAAALTLSVSHLPVPRREGFALLGSFPAVEFDAFAAAALWDDPVDAAEDALQELVDVHLLEESAAGRYRLHDLTRDYARAMDEPERPAAERRLVDLYLATAAHASEVFQAEGSTRFPKLVPDVPRDRLPRFVDKAAAAAWFEENLDTIVHLARTAADSRSVGLLRNTVKFLMMRNRAREMITLGLLAEAGTTAAGRPEDRAWTLEVTGIGYAKMRELETAVEYFEAGLAVAGERDRGYALNALAVTCLSLWRLPEARRYGEQSVAHAKAGSDHRGVCLGLVNLARIAIRQGRLEDGAELGREVLTLARAIGYDTGASTALLTIADAVRLQGRQEEAIVVYQECFRMAEELSYLDNLVDSLHGLASAHRGLGEPEVGLALHEQADAALADNGRSQTDHPALRNERARTEWAAGRRGEAARSAARALELARESRNPFEEGRALVLLAEITAAEGDGIEAGQLAQQAKEIREGLEQLCQGELISWDAGF